MIVCVLLCYSVSIHMSHLLSTRHPIFFLNAVYLQNRVSCPFSVAKSCIWPLMRPWSSYPYEFHNFIKLDMIAQITW